jgi:IS5 family transposase
MKQLALAMNGYFDKGKKTRREELLAEMDQVVPWVRLCALIEPNDPKGNPAGGRPPLSVQRVFRMYCPQQ